MPPIFLPICTSDHLQGARKGEWLVNKGRLEAFTDAVIAIILTILVLELNPPHSGFAIGFALGTSRLVWYLPGLVFNVDGVLE